MKVWIRSGKTRLLLLLPTGLVLNRLTAKIAVTAVRNRYPSLAFGTEDVQKLLDAIKDHKRRHPHWVLVDVTTADGERVYVHL